MGPSRLLVEGPDDKHVMWALLAAHRVPRSFSVEDVGGIQPLLENLRVRLRARSDARLGVVVDADEQIAARWASLRGEVEKVFPGVLPEQPDLQGTVAKLPGDRRLGVWLMPDNRLPGILEDFVALLVPEVDPCWTPAVDFVDGLQGKARLFAENRRAKARVHAWLAIQAEPGRPMGQAITAKYLESTSDAAHAFVAWVRRLFED